MQHKLALGVGIAGAVVIVLAGILGWVVVPKIIDDKIKEEVQLRPGTDVFEKWMDIPYPIYLKFYIFHVKNADEVMKNGATPELEEKGPYAYLQKRSRPGLTNYDLANPDNTVQYKERKTYFWDQKASGNNKQDDLVDIINIAFVSVVHGVRSRLPVLAQPVANQLLKGEQLIRKNVKVRELLFDGFNVSKYTTNPLLGPMLPEEFSGGKFGVYKLENGTDSKIYDIYTGVDNYKDFGRIRTYDGDEYLKFWQNRSFCDRVKGGDGSLFPPFMKKDSEFFVFSNDLCRSLKFVFDSEQVFKDVDVLRYRVPPRELEDPRTNPENQCYCMTDTLDECPKAGSMSLEKCRDGAPIMMSTPYFLDGDQGNREAAGMPPPEEEKHLTFLDIQPDSGVLLRGHKRIQVNLDLKIGYGIDAYAGQKKDMLFPLLWADESAEVDDETVDDLKSQLLKPKKIVGIVKWVVLGLGIVGVLAGVALFYFGRRKSRNVV